MHNIDRGIIKWLPFDALSGYKEAILKLKERKNKINMPVLSEDQIAELNYEFTVAVNLKKNITVYYFQAGTIYFLTGIITDVDTISKKIKLGNKWLFKKNILKIKIN